MEINYMHQQQEKIKNKGVQDCNKCGLNYQLKTRHKQLRAWTRNLLRVQEDERQRFSRELHDKLGQWLTAVYAEAEAISAHGHKDITILAGVRSIKESVSKMNDFVHNLMYELRPTLLDTFGLVESLQELGKKWASLCPDINFNFVLKGECDNFDEMINITTYRIVKEALDNIGIHTKATWVRVQLNNTLGSTQTNVLLVSIEDNGKGCDPEQQSVGFGILEMRERTIAAGGEFNIFSVLGYGTQINASFPILSLPSSP